MRSVFAEAWKDYHGLFDGSSVFFAIAKLDFHAVGEMDLTPLFRPGNQSNLPASRVSYVQLLGESTFEFVFK